MNFNFNTRWCISDMNGYEPKTTFWSDFNIAEAFGEDAIRDTYKRAFESWKTNVDYVTELSLVMNHKIWFWWDVSQQSDKLDKEVIDTADVYSRLYDELWSKLDIWCGENLKGADAEYYYRVTD